VKKDCYSNKVAAGLNKYNEFHSEIDWFSGWAATLKRSCFTLGKDHRRCAEPYENPGRVRKSPVSVSMKRHIRNKVTGFVVWYLVTIHCWAIDAIPQSQGCAWLSKKDSRKWSLTFLSALIKGIRACKARSPHSNLMSAHSSSIDSRRWTRTHTTGVCCNSCLFQGRGLVLPVQQCCQTPLYPYVGLPCPFWSNWMSKARSKSAVLW